LSSGIAYIFAEAGQSGESVRMVRIPSILLYLDLIISYSQIVFSGLDESLQVSGIQVQRFWVLGSRI
jgi:hypothetical protein